MLFLSYWKLWGCRENLKVIRPLRKAIAVIQEEGMDLGVPGGILRGA